MSEAHEMIQELNRSLEIMLSHRPNICGTEHILFVNARIKDITDCIQLVARTASAPLLIMNKDKP